MTGLPPTGECSNKECPFLHIDPESKIKDCPWYDRGFCKHGKCPLPPLAPAWTTGEQGPGPPRLYLSPLLPLGPLCRHRHTRRVICVNYLVGFCPEGPSCKFMQ